MQVHLTALIARFGAMGGFETAVFDEAAQAGELATLVPLQHGAHRVVLVGDPQQLPATVLSIEAKRLGFGRSLFERRAQPVQRAAAAAAAEVGAGSI